MSLLTMKEAAIELRVSHSTIKKMIRNGELACVRLSLRVLLIESNYLNEFIAEKIMEGKQCSERNQATYNRETKNVLRMPKHEAPAKRVCRSRPPKYNKSRKAVTA